MTRPEHDQKLEGILASAAKVFAERGYHQTSMRDLARASGVSLSGLYYYFKSKEELLYLIQDRNFAAVLADLHEALDGVRRPIDRLTHFIENHLEYFATHMHEMKVLSHEAGALTGAFLAEVDAKKREYTLTLMDILAEVEKEHGGAHVNRRVATYLLFGMTNWIYNWYDPLGDVDVRLLGQSVTRLFLGGYIGQAVGTQQLPHTTAG